MDVGGGLRHAAAGLNDELEGSVGNRAAHLSGVTPGAAPSKSGVNDWIWRFCFIQPLTYHWALLRPPPRTADQQLITKIAGHPAHVALRRCVVTVYLRFITTALLP
jgi:hypothetical protein